MSKLTEAARGQECTLQTVIEDVKGMATPEYKLKKAIMACMGHQIREYKRRG